MPTYSLESPTTGQTYQVQFDREPTPADLDFAATQFDNEWWEQQGIEPSSAVTQQTPLQTVGSALANVGPALAGMVGGGMRYLDKATEVLADVTGLQRGGLFGDVARQAESIANEGELLRPLNPANPIAQTIGQGAAQGIGILGTAAASVPALGARALMAVPAALGFGAGAGEGVRTGEQMGLSPAAQVGMGTAFGAAEAATEALGGIGGRFLPPAKGLVGKVLGGAASEVIEEPASGALTEAITNVAALPVADAQRPGFTKTGFQIPGPEGYLQRRGQEALGGLAGGVVFAGAQLAAGMGQPMSQAPAPTAPVDAIAAEDTGELTAADVAEFEAGINGQKTGQNEFPNADSPAVSGPVNATSRQAILQGVPDLAPRMRESSLNAEPLMEGDVITDLRVPRSPQAIAESQRAEKERQAQVSKLRMLDAQAKGVPMIADSPTGSRDILDWANENPIYLPPGFSEQRKLPEYEALSRNPLPPYWRQFVASGKQGGNPDTIAQRAFDAGLIAEPTADAYMMALQDGIAGRQQYRVQFQAREKDLAQEEKRVVDFEKTQDKLAKKPQAQQVPFEDITPGDAMTIDGEQAVVRNVEYNEDGYLTNVVIEDGKRFGLMQFDAQSRGGILVDEYQPRPRQAVNDFAPQPTFQQPPTGGQSAQPGSASVTPAGSSPAAATLTRTTASMPASPRQTAPAATSASGGVRANGNGAGASPAMAPGSGEVNLEDLNAELQMAGGMTNFRVDGTTAGFANAQILNEALDLVKQGFTTFANWSKAMVTRFGRGIQEFLAAIWQQITSLQSNAARNVRLGMPQGTAPVTVGAGGFVGGGQGQTIPEGQDVTRSRFASPDEAANLYDVQATETMRGESAAWIKANGLDAALAALESNTPPAGLRIDHLPSLGAQLITRLSKLAETGTEAQRLQADAMLDRAGAAWHGKASQEAGRTLQQRAMANQELAGIAPILAAKQVLTDRADRVIKERFEGGAEGAVAAVKDIDAKASTEAGAELTAQLEGEPEAPELGDNPEVEPVSDARVAELEQQMQALREQMVRAETQADTTIAQTSSTWQKIMAVMQGASSRKSAILTGAKGRLAAMRKAAQARKAARRAEGRLNANPVEDFADDAIIGAAFLAEGLVEFTNWSQAMLRELGYRSGQDLRKLYAEASKQYLAALEAEKAAPTKSKGTPKQRAAREKINRAQRTAQNILDSLARRYSDPPIFDEGQRKVNAMRELYKKRVRTGMPEAEFVQRAKALGANEGTSGILWEASKLEIDAREVMALEKSRAGMAAYLQKDSPALAKLLDALRKKIAPGMTWAEIFMTLPAEQKARQKEIYRRLMLDQRLKALNQGERLQLTNELDRAWQRERRKVFMRELEKMTGPGKAPKDKAKVKAALPRLLRLMNLGMLNSETFRGALAQEYGLKQIDAATGAELRKLGEAIQQAPEGLPRRKLEQQLMQRLQNLTGSTLFQVLDSWWTASVLSGLRTQVDIGASILNGIEDVGLGSIVTALRTGNKDVAVRGLGRLFARLPSAFLESVDHVATGNKALMRSFELEAKQALEGGNKLASDVGAEMWRKGGWRKVPGGFMIFYGRVMTALDHINTASTREGALAMALARHPELYEKALKISDADKLAARNQARLELTGGDMPRTMQQRLEENARVRELLERGIPREILGEATDIGRAAAMQGDPTGIGGGLLDAVNMAVGTVARKAESMSQRENLDATSKQVLKLLQGTAPVMRAITGTKFARTVAHSLNRTLSYVPVAGVYAVGQQGRTGAFGDVLAAKQVIGTLVGLALYLAFDDDEDEKGIEDGWKDKTPQEKAQLYAQGKQPYTVWSRNAKGQVVAYNYQQWGISGIVNTVAAMLKQKGSEQGTLNVLVSSLVQGAMTFTDKAQLQGLQTVFGENYRSTDPVSGVASNLNRWAAQTVGGMIPRVIKDIDVVTSPELRTSSEWWQKWTKEMPMLRQLSSGKRVDILGEDIKLDRGPLSRVLSIGTFDPAYRVLGRLNERDIYLPDPTQGVRVVPMADGTRRKMTELEKDRYQRATGAAYRKFLMENGTALLKLEPEAARTLISNVTERLRAQAANEAVRR